MRTFSLKYNLGLKLTLLKILSYVEPFFYPEKKIYQFREMDRPD
jgi:hypothetical protein